MHNNNNSSFVLSFTDLHKLYDYQIINLVSWRGKDYAIIYLKPKTKFSIDF